MNNRKIVVIAPVKNEEWILEEFLTAASRFADHIVIGDHASNDSSVAIAKQFEKVVVFSTNQIGFSERERRNELLIRAREFGEGNCILSLDADELLTPNFVSPANLDKLRGLPVGTRIRLPFFNLRPDLRTYWEVPQAPIGFIDDGSMHEHNEAVHFPRVPPGKGSQIFEIEGEGLLHLQYLDWRRMESKHRWYQAWERVNFSKKPPLLITRRYSHMHAIPKKRLKTVNEEWLTQHEELGIDFRKLAMPRENYWWDEETIQLVEQRGLEHFEYLDLAPLFCQKQISLKNRMYWWYIIKTTPITGRRKYSLLRLAVRLIDIPASYYWR